LGKAKPLPPKKYNQSLIRVTEGRPFIKNYSVLRDHRHVLCENSDGSIYMFDLASLNKTPVEESKSLKELTDKLNAKLKSKGTDAWCNVDIKLGSLSLILDFSSWMKGEGKLNMEEKNGRQINYGKNIMSLIFDKIIRNKLANTLPLIKSVLTTSQIEDYIKANQAVSEGINIKLISKSTITINDKKKCISTSYEDIDNIKDDIPRWVMDTLYTSPFPNDQRELKFTLKPVKLDAITMRTLGLTDLNSYSVSSNTNTLIEHVMDLAKSEILKLTKRVDSVSLEIDGKQLHPLVPVGIICVYPSAERLTIQYRINLSNI